MTRAQRKARIQKLENKCETLQKQNERELRKQQKAFREREEKYVEHIEKLQELLTDGKYYRTEKVCVDIDQRKKNANIPKNILDEYINQRIMNEMLRVLSKRTDLLQRTEHPYHTTFYMEVLKLDDRPIPTLTIPEEYAGNPFEEI